MQEIRLWEGNICPLCETQGINSKLKFFRLNLRDAALLCTHKKCPFPLSTNYPDTFVRVGRDGKIIPGSQSERGWPHEEEDDSDDSPYISDTSEDSVTFPDIVPEVKNLHNISSVNTNKKGPSEVDAFDISSIDFETDDSMDTFKLQNEMTALEMEINKSVENMKSKDSSLFNINSEKCKNPISMTDKEFTSSFYTVYIEQHEELDINDSSSVKTNERGAEWYNDRKSGNITLHEHDSSTSIPGSLELTKMSDESANCKQQSKVKISVSNKSISNHKHADVQNNSNINCQDTDCSADGDHGGVLEGAKSIVNDNYSENRVEKQDNIFFMTNTSKPKPEPLLLNPQSTENAVGNYLPIKHELHAELFRSESATIKKDNDCGKDKFSDEEVDVIFGAHEDNDFSDDTAEKQLGTFSMADTSNPEPKPLLLLPPQSTENILKNNLSRKRDLQTESGSSELVPYRKGKGCGKKKYDDEADIIYDECSKSYKIVAIDSNMSSTDYKIIDLKGSFCKIQNSSGAIDGRKTKNVQHSAQNTVEKLGSNTASVTPVKLNVVEKGGQFVCTQNNSPSSVSEVEEVKELQKPSAGNKVHSKNCVCFLCKESTRGITSHLDRALADIFPEEHTVVKNLTDKELPTETEIMRDFVHYMNGNTKRSPKNKKRLFHL